MRNRTLTSVVPKPGVLFAAAICALVVSCKKDPAAPEERDVDATIAINAAAAANGTTAALNGYTFIGLYGSTLAANTVPANTGLVGQTAVIAFTNVNGANGNFTLTTFNVTASGTVQFLSCRFTVNISSNAAVLPVGAVITISNCSVRYVANDVPVGGTTGTSGTVRLILNGVAGGTLNTTVRIQANGILVVTNRLGVSVVTVTVIVTTGSSGG